MAKKSNCDIYGPSLDIHERQGRDIAEMGLRCMKGNKSVSESDTSKDNDASHSELEKWQSKP